MGSLLDRLKRAFMPEDLPADAADCFRGFTHTIGQEFLDLEARPEPKAGTGGLPVEVADPEEVKPVVEPLTINS